MLGENIRQYRKAKGISQEEMAIKLNVVRQTVSKWENGLSVPDADVLMSIAELLDVPVSLLLGTRSESYVNSNLSDELAKVNEELAELRRREKLMLQASKKRGLIIFLSFISMLTALAIKNELLSLILTGLCLLIALIILYRNLTLLTSVTNPKAKTGILRLTTVFTICILLLVIAFAALSSLDMISFSESEEKLIAIAVIASVKLFGGIICPRLPFNRHTGLRLPWTVQDEETWNVAHRVMGYISLPIALLYIACALTLPDFETVTVCSIIIWIGIPALISLVYFYKKTNGKLK